jgi:hypothetical protein
MFGVVLQTEAGTNTALMEVLLMVITALLAAIAWGLRKAYKSITETLKQVRETQDEQGKRIHRNRTSLFGKDGTPWNGFENEIKKSRSGIIQAHETLNQQATALKRHRRALKRADLLAPNHETESMNPEFDDLESLDTPEEP